MGKIEQGAAIRCERGLAAVELAISIPLLVMIMMGVGEVGRAFYQYNTLQKATRDGLAYFAANVRNNAGVVPSDFTVGTAATLAITTRHLIACGSPADCGTNTLLEGFKKTENVGLAKVGSDHVRAIVTYTYQPVFLAIPSFGGSSITVPVNFSVTLTMRAL